MMEFKVGDKVRVVSQSFSWSNVKKGDVGTIQKIDGNRFRLNIPHFSKFRTWSCLEKDIELIEPKPSKKQRITALEETVATLTEQLQALQQQVNERFEPSTVVVAVDGDTASLAKVIEETIEFEGATYVRVDRLAREGDVVVFDERETARTVGIVPGKPYKVYMINGEPYFKADTRFGNYRVYRDFRGRTPETVKVYERIEQPVQRQTVACAVERTANELRAEVIEKAKEFVIQALNRNYSAREEGISVWFVEGEKKFFVTHHCEFVCNIEKRTIVALVKLSDSNDVHHRGIAKCNPSDVFNSHIGKAIALGRALGLDVSEFENAAQPTEVAEGHVIYEKDFNSTDIVSKATDEEIQTNGRDFYHK